MQIFERGAAALGHDIYICPLCMREFTRQAVDKRVLTWEHVPPESVGGKKIILTCKPCNSRGGSALDSAVHQRDQHDQFFEAVVLGTREFEDLLKLEMFGENLNVRLLIQEGERKIEIAPGLNDPAVVQRLLEARGRLEQEGAWKDTEFKLTTIQGFKQRRAQLGDLRIAYLAAFAMFGYRYIRLPELAVVRDQLRHPEQDLLPKGFQTYLGWNTSRERSVWIIRDPVRMIFIRLDRTAVVLPTFEAHGEPWTSFREKVSDESRVSLRGDNVGWPTGPRFMLDLPRELNLPPTETP